MGHYFETTLHYQKHQLISTAITAAVTPGQTLALTVDFAGCYLFDATGRCIWEGATNA